MLQGSTGMTRPTRPARRIARFPLDSAHPMKRLALLAALVLVAAPASAQDSTKKEPVKMAGNWDFSFTSPQGAANWRIKFEQSADTLWGTASTDFGEINVSDGWIAGNDISFTLNLNFQGTAISVNFAGTVKGDTASGQIDVPNAGIQPFPFTAIRAAGEFVQARSTTVDRPRVVARLE